MGLVIIVLSVAILIIYLLTKSAENAMWRGEKEYYMSTGKLRNAGEHANHFNPDYPERRNGYKHGYNDFGPKTVEALERELNPSKCPRMEVIKLNSRNPEEVYSAIASGELVYIGDKQTLGGWKLKRSKWFNPFKPDKPGKKRDGTREEILIKYREYITNSPELLADLHELKGKKLGCWCKPLDCHGDILKELVQDD